MLCPWSPLRGRTPDPQTSVIGSRCALTIWPGNSGPWSASVCRSARLVWSKVESKNCVRQLRVSRCSVRSAAVKIKRTEPRASSDSESPLRNGYARVAIWATYREQVPRMIKVVVSQQFLSYSFESYRSWLLTLLIFAIHWIITKQTTTRSLSVVIDCL